MYFYPWPKGSYPLKMYYYPRRSGPHPLNMYFYPRRSGNFPRLSGTFLWRMGFYPVSEYFKLRGTADRNWRGGDQRKRPGHGRVFRHLTDGMERTTGRPL